MIKVFYLLSLAIFMVLVNSQASPRVDANGIMYISTIPDWACTVYFNSHGAPLYTESLSLYNQYNDNHFMDLSNSGNLDSISWSGSSCYCWVVIFEHSSFAGQSLGLWIGSTSGSIDLSLYNFLDDSDLFEDDYAQWNNEVTSYRIYCY
jgi:hypothetical protein